MLILRPEGLSTRNIHVKHNNTSWRLAFLGVGDSGRASACWILYSKHKLITQFVVSNAQNTNGKENSFFHSGIHLSRSTCRLESVKRVPVLFVPLLNCHTSKTTIRRFIQNGGIFMTGKSDVTLESKSFKKFLRLDLCLVAHERRVNND